MQPIALPVGIQLADSIEDLLRLAVKRRLTEVAAEVVWDDDDGAGRRGLKNGAAEGLDPVGVME